MNKIKKKWLYIEPYCMLKKSGDNKEILIYNTVSSESVKVNHSCKLFDVCNSLLLPENMYFAELPEDISEDSFSYSLIEKIRSTFSGDILDSYEEDLPVNFFPMLSLQRDIDRLKQDRDLSDGENLMNYLNEITVYLNQECSQDCDNCHIFYKQYLSCTKDTVGDIDLKKTYSILEKVAGDNLAKINITGGNIFKYTSFSDVVNHFNALPILKNYVLSIKNVNINKFSSILSNNNNSILVQVCFPLEHHFFSGTFLALNNYQKVEVQFFVCSEGELSEAEIIIDCYNLEKVSIVPIYTGENLSFFEQYVYVDEADILETKISQREIFANQVLNTNFFGKLIILSNGDAYANLSDPKLGSIYNESIKDLLYKELIAQHSWRKIRNTKPCSDCIYQWLCPSPSNYELAIGTPNLCHVKQQQ